MDELNSVFYYSKLDALELNKLFVRDIQFFLYIFSQFSMISYNIEIYRILFFL